MTWPKRIAVTVPVLLCVFLCPELGASKRRLIRAVREALLENLELVPSNSRHNTSIKTFECWERGNKAEIRFLFISSSFPLYFHLPRFAGLKRKYSGNAFPLLNRPSSLFMHVIAHERRLFCGFQRVADAHVDGVDDGDAGGEFAEIRSADKIGDEGIDGQRAQ